MVGRRGWSRRNAIGAMAGGLSSTLLLLAKAAEAADKMTKARAQYQDRPNGIYSCATCTLFEKPNGCKVVEGEVSPDGWCTAFAMAD
jgi:High potential iron-sulfur protein